ncbi:panthothenate synthetase [Pseudomonas fluorescens]|uniref:panthothenate synthetase n=1 Tax=Pseudomonas TaxID=286 RepID=UPI003D028CCE
MKMLMMVECPNEPFNALVRAGKVGEVIERILESIKPEAAYFTEQDGMRGGIFLIDVQDSSQIPSFAEPFFLNFDATCKFRLVMSPQDLQRAGLEALGNTWG